MSTRDPARDQKRLTAALRLVLIRYGRQLRQRPFLTAGAIVFPALGDILNLYAPPLIIARLLARFARNEALGPRELLPYIAAFAALWLGGQACWRVAVVFITRVEIHALKSLYVETM